jgi:hypothetical protein
LVLEELTRSQEPLIRVNVQLLEQVAGLEQTVDTCNNRLANMTSQCTLLIKLLTELHEKNAAVQSDIKLALAPSPKAGKSNLQNSMMKLFQEKGTCEKALLRVEEFLSQNDAGILNVRGLVDSIIAGGNLVS